MSGDDVLMMRGAPRVEVFTGTHRRRRWHPEQKAAIVAESFATSVGEAAGRHGVSKAQLFNWRREARDVGDLVSFARVEAEPQSLAPPIGPAAPIEILTSDIVVRVRSGADPSLVSTIVVALRSVVP
jgi:transposase